MVASSRLRAPREGILQICDLVTIVARQPAPCARRQWRFGVARSEHLRHAAIEVPIVVVNFPASIGHVDVGMKGEDMVQKVVPARGAPITRKVESVISRALQRRRMPAAGALCARLPRINPDLGYLL